MYVYYEHHRDINNKIVLTELRLSSKDNGSLSLNFKNQVENMIFESCKPVLKCPPLSAYSYDPATKVWSYFGQYGVNGTWGEEVIKKLEAVVKALGSKFKAFAIEDLAGQAVNNSVDMSAKSKPRMSAEEFFYNHGAPVAQNELTREQIQQKFRDLTGAVAMDKKSYRSAAARFHPDVIGGNAAKMSEINMLWQMWQRLAAQEVVNA